MMKVFFNFIFMSGGTVGSPVGGAFQHVPGGDLGLSRDDGCWCQPINQACTALRPNNLDLVTRIVNRVGSETLIIF